MALRPIDRVTLAYLAVALGFTLAHGPRQGRDALVAVAFLLLAALVAGVVAPQLRAGGAVARFLGEFYPLLLLFGL